MYTPSLQGLKLIKDSMADETLLRPNMLLHSSIQESLPTCNPVTNVTMPCLSVE
jgi:hypothetical protein